MATDEPVSKKSKVEEKVKSVVDDDTKKLIVEKCLVTMPKDFYDFWNFLCTFNDGYPDKVLRRFELRLGGPFQVLQGKSSETNSDYLLHHRFFYDPPEFQTVLLSMAKGSQYHIGYYRDCPSEDPVFVASNNGKDCKLSILSDNLFGALHSYLQGVGSKASVLVSKLESFAKTNGYELGKRTATIKAREKKVVSKGFHGAGIVVPLDENEVGWREVPRTIGELKKLFAAIVKGDKSSEPAADELQELITYVQFANDEGDYGQGLELGGDLFCYGEETLHGYVKALLPMAYSLLGYGPFEQIILAHTDKRSKTTSELLT